jgi:hypothetical protein
MNGWLNCFDSSIQFINPVGLKMLGWNSYEGKTIMDTASHHQSRENAAKFSSHSLNTTMNIMTKYSLE